MEAMTYGQTGKLKINQQNFLIWLEDLTKRLCHSDGATHSYIGHKLKLQFLFFIFNPEDSFDP